MCKKEHCKSLLYKSSSKAVRLYRMAKSAINLLQEISIKQGFIPIYNFMEKRTNDTNSMQFICIVSCKQLNAHGTGRSKKEAKHSAANNMLLLFDTNNKISSPINTASSSSVANVIQSPAKVYETSLSQLTVDRNYVGLLQEFCQQQKIPTTNILYELVADQGLPQLKTFTIEVSLGSLRQRATAQCKKIAKQQAARKLLLSLNSNVANPNAVNDSNAANLNVVNLNRANPNLADSSVADANILNINRLNIYDNETLENDIRKLGTEILDCVPSKDTFSIAKLSERAKSLYLECTDKTYNRFNQNPSAIKELHTLFERNHSNEIPYSTREKMRIIRDKYTDQMDLSQIRREIEKSLKVKIQQITVHSITKNHVICLRLSSNPCITQFGIGETKFIAESRAMYNLVAAILTFLNV